MFKYEDPPENALKGLWFEEKLREAALHDPIVSQYYSLFRNVVSVRQDPFNDHRFYQLLAYQALRMNQKHMKSLFESVQKAVNPPIILQYGGEFIPKYLVDKLEAMRDTRSWHQKMIDKLFK